MEPLRAIADNQVVFEALKTKLLSKFVVDKIDPAFLELPNELLGERVRARVSGRELVEEALNEISAYKTIKSEDGKLNPAR